MKVGGVVAWTSRKSGDRELHRPGHGPLAQRGLDRDRPGQRAGGARRRHGRLQRRRSGERHGDHGDRQRDAPDPRQHAKPNQIDPRTNQTIAARLLREQVLQANSSIYQAAQSQPQYAGMGTTLVVSLFYDNRVLVAHLGDSRLYLLRDGELAPGDARSFAAAGADRFRPAHRRAGEERAAQEPRHQGARHRSERRARDPRISDASPATSICCAPTACATWSRTRTSARRCRRSAGNLKLAAQQLVQMANDNGGRDNVSVILVRVLREYPGPAGVIAKVFAWLK